MYAIPGRDETPDASNSEALEGVRAGKYDVLFERAPDKPSDLYLGPTSSAHSQGAVVKQLSVPTGGVPSAPNILPLQETRIEGVIDFKVKIDTGGNATNFMVETGHPMLQGAVKEAASGWKFSRNPATYDVHAAIEFALNCLSQPSKISRSRRIGVSRSSLSLRLRTTRNNNWERIC
jgi:hypothetical protein